MRAVTRRSLVAGLAVMTGATAPEPSAAQARPAATGWREAVFVVADLRPWIETLTAVGGWEVWARNGPDASLNTLWAMPAQARAEQVLMRNRGEASGLIRLVRVSGSPQRRIRPDDQAWETGGVAALDLRVLDMDSTRSALQARGWRAPSDPVRYEAYPGVEVIQWAPVSPDGVRLSFIQRLSPPLVGWPALKRWSRAINAAMVVKDIAAPARFFGQTLGLPVGGRSTAVGTSGPNVMGLPWSFQKETSTQILGFRSKGDDGSVELICIPAAQGRDYSAGAHPPNLGIAGLRWLVDDLPALIATLESQGGPIPSPTRRVVMEPYGPCSACVATTGDGVWLEFVQRPH